MTPQPYRILYILDAHTAVAPSEDEAQLRVDRVAISRLNAQDAAAWQLTEQAHFILVLTHGSVSCFRGLQRLIAGLRMEQTLFVHNNMEDECAALMLQLRLSAADYLTIQRYVKCYDRANATQLHRFLASRFGGMELDYAPARYPRWHGLYGYREDEEAARLTELGEARRRGRSIIGIIIPFYLYRSDNLRHVDALLAALRRLGGEPHALFSTGAEDAVTGERGISYALDRYFRPEGEVLPHCIINLMPYALGIFEQSGAIYTQPEDSCVGIVQQLALPILQTYATGYSAEEYHRRVDGLDTIGLISNVCYPELDGQVDAYPIATRELNGEGLPYFAPLEAELGWVARLAMRWAELQRKPQSEKRIAIIFHNMPPRNDSIGCAAGLDSPASVHHLINRLRAEGIELPEHYADGDAIIQQIIRAVTNDSSWLEPSEVMRRAVDRIPVKRYQEWYEALTPEVQQRLEASWGKAPGDFKVVEGAMPVPGIINGKVFIGLQPPRGYEEHAEAIYHSTDIVCPHYYIAFYRWVRYVFGADLFIHVGTHGSLEWLPGKEKALSYSCFPQLNTLDMPHLYIYHTAVIGEAIQAKRRSAAVLLHHMEPAMREGGTYGGLADFDARLNSYISGAVAESQRPVLREALLEEARALELHQDLGYPATGEVEEDFFVALHNWLAELKASMVRDGLHIFGQVPTEERMEASIRMLLRLPHGSVTTLLDALARYYGYTEEGLLAELEAKVSPTQTASMLIDELTERGRQLITMMLAEGFGAQPTEGQLQAVLGPCLGEADALRAVLQLALDEVYPRLCGITQELDHCALGVRGGFVPPSKGGSPSRGQLEILPTGRNMYAIDPSEIPSHAAYQIGVKLGQQLLEKHLETAGSLPESTAFVLYSGDQMRTQGEDIAEILWLMGLRPQWLSDHSDKVVGLEVIPLSELGRPRLDVVSRISGLLRDTFPTLITLLDEAVRLVLSLDESPENNWVKKHYEEELEQLQAEGIDPETARQEAALRVFGCPPGTYGGGVAILVETKQWQSSDDLGETAITWGCHAYSQELHGRVSRDAFERKLSRVEATVKNQNIIGFDLYDIDDEYIYHGGIIAAVKKLRGEAPKSYYGNTSDPRHSVVRSLAEESARVLRSRLLNPLWIEGLKRHGYRGAYDVAYNMDNVFGWDATADSVLDWNYEALAEHFLGDASNREWLASANPWALYEIAQRLLEAAQRGMWQARPETLEMITEVYLSCEGQLEESAAAPQSAAASPQS